MKTTRILLILLLCGGIQAQSKTTGASAPHVDVYVESTSNDVIGKSFVYDLKEAIEQNQRTPAQDLGNYRYVSEIPDGGVTLHVVSVPIEPGKDLSAAVAIAMTMKLGKDEPQLFVGNLVLVVGKTKTADAAQMTLRELQRQLGEFFSRIRFAPK